MTGSSAVAGSSAHTGAWRASATTNAPPRLAPRLLMKRTSLACDVQRHELALGAQVEPLAGERRHRPGLASKHLGEGLFAVSVRSRLHERELAIVRQYPEVAVGGQQRSLAVSSLL